MMIESTENYLKSIFNLQQEQKGPVKSSQIAHTLDVSPAAVSDMLKKLAAKRLIAYEPYKGVRLSKKGMEKGRNMIRRHRIWELYLNTILGIPLEKVHDEAEMLEHASSDNLINRLEEVLGFPKFDPHGDPIPDKNGDMPVRKNVIPLSTCQPGQVGVVVRVSDIDESFLTYLASINVKLKNDVKVIESRDFDGSLQIRINNQENNISYFTAKNIFIQTKEDT